MHAVRTGIRYRWFMGAFVLLLVIWCPRPLSAQSKLADRLPANTIAYVEWHGSPAVLTNVAKNHMLQLAIDPKFAPVWAGLAQNIQAGQKKPGLSLGLPDVISLLTNPFALGAVELPPGPAASISSVPGKLPAQRVATFFIYDSTGKTELVQRLMAANSQSGPNAGPWTSYDFRGFKIESRTVGTGSTFRVQAAKYYLIANQKQVIEELIRRFAGTEQPASSLAQLAQYQQARKHMDAGAAMEFFFRVPDVRALVAAASPQGKTQSQALAGLHLEKIQAGGGSLSFAGESTRMRGAILGDTSPGGLFDLAGESQASFVTQPLANMGVLYSASRINWAAGYEFLRYAMGGNLTPQQGATVNMGDAMAQAFLGMSIDDALKLFSGEMATVNSYSADGETQSLYAVAIQKPEAVLRILRAVGGKMIVAEDAAGTTTYLDIAYPYHDPVSGTQRRKFYYVAVTPGMILVAPRKAMLRQAASLLASPAGAPAGIFANPEYQQLRANLPEKLSGFGAADLTRIPWDKMAANLGTQLEAGAKKQDATVPPAAGWLESFPPDVISRHLQVSVGGWWKDANGIYFDSYLQ